MQIRPLQFMRVFADGHLMCGEKFKHSPVVYGKSVYVTHGEQFIIMKMLNGWQIRNPRSDNPLHQECLDAGIYDTYFKRRSDAIAALEAIIACAEVSA